MKGFVLKGHRKLSGTSRCGDFIRKPNCCHKALVILQEKNSKLLVYSISFVYELKEPDKAEVTVNGLHVNYQHSHLGASENPHAVHQEAPHPEKCAVWRANSRWRMICPVIFETSFTTAVYMDNLQKLATESDYVITSITGQTSHLQLRRQRNKNCAEASRSKLFLSLSAPLSPPAQTTPVEGRVLELGNYKSVVHSNIIMPKLLTRLKLTWSRHIGYAAKTQEWPSVGTEHTCGTGGSPRRQTAIFRARANISEQ
ncbi:hypothetical protein PR048_010361 [Dryococelus australis]|uniref:Uncharacterized protein n=1 Tax=Dryococelus australis TaxID=614101 RepID=A0ABQ9I2G8_9NEOP|nr:hypothetical protein PR048_010361 [Dryococelus australis]